MSSRWSHRAVVAFLATLALPGLAAPGLTLMFLAMVLLCTATTTWGNLGGCPLAVHPRPRASWSTLLSSEGMR
jgi:hypothetical protein